MKQTLVIGSTVVDVLLGVPSLPLRGGDVNVLKQEYKVGGCAYNVFKTLQLFESPATLCSPVGQGIYGNMVRKHLEEEGLVPFVSLEEENGCCYCLVEGDGERSFLSFHGAEYLFSRSWMDKIDYSQTGSIFICGLEIEEATGGEIIDFVYEHPKLELFFAPGPRIRFIQGEKMDRLLSRRDKDGKGPFLHLNEIEAIRYSGLRKFNEAAEFIAGKTENGLVITLGQRGCYCLDKSSSEKPDGHITAGFPATVVDTVGAGDSHCGAIIACLKSGMGLKEACRVANRIGAAVVSMRGSVLDKLPALA